MTVNKMVTALLGVLFLSVGTCVFGSEEAETATADSQSVDLTADFEKWGLRRINQGSRPTCSVCTIVGALEYSLGKFGDSPQKLSVEFANWAKNEAGSQKGDGGFFSNIWRGYKKLGICPEESFPYEKTFDPERAPSDDAIKEAKKLLDVRIEINWVKRWNPNTGLTEEQFQKIKSTLRERLPVCVGMRWPHKARRSHGILLSVADEDVYDGHSVLLVGYQDDETIEGGGYFLVRNTNNPKSNDRISYEYVKRFTNDAIFFSQPVDSE